MPFRISQLPTDDKLPLDFSLPLLEQLYPRELVSDLLSQEQRWGQRERKLNQVLMVSLLIAWPLFLKHSLRRVFVQLSSALRLLSGLSALVVPTEAALTYRRKQLGVRIMRALLLRACHPLATPETPGAFAFGLRLMGIDGTLEDVKDTPSNAAFFGRLSEGETKSPFPQARCVYLVEVGTHAIINAILAPCKADEHRLSWDRPCCSCWIAALSRVPSFRRCEHAGRTCWVGWLRAFLPSVNRCLMMAAI